MKYLIAKVGKTPYSEGKKVIVSYEVNEEMVEKLAELENKYGNTVFVDFEAMNTKLI